MKFFRAAMSPVAWLLATLPGCAPVPAFDHVTNVTVLPGTETGVARLNGIVGTPDAAPPPQIGYGSPTSIAISPSAAEGASGGDITLDFADSDIHAVVEQILGSILRVNYTIDPAVHGTVTLHTATPLARSQLLPTLQALLAQDAAAVVRTGNLYRVVPAAAAAGAGDLAEGATAGSILVPLRYASADDLAKVLQPFAGTGAHITPDSGQNALLISADVGVRDSLIRLIHAFDVDILAGTSYALLPVPEGAAKDFSTSLQDAFRTQGGAGLSGVLRVVPMDRMNAVLVVSTQPRYIDEARRVYALVERSRRLTVRSWHVYYLQNSHAQDVAYVLQEAFTPNSVTAEPSSGGAGQTAPGSTTRTTSAQGSGGAGAGSGGFGNTLSGGGIGTGTSLSGGAAGGNAAASGASAAATTSPIAANPLLGGLDASSTGADTNTMRIIPNSQNNALLVYATQQEEETVEAMLRKIDILPLQVRIDAVIAEVTLNDQLQYGTQFFFKSGGVNGILNNSASAVALTNPASAVLSTSFPGFILGGNGQGGAPIALQALQAVTTVHVLSSPELLVLDNQPARLQVGDLVPYLTSSSQSTLTTGSPVINSVNYQPTGVILQVTPRVNSGGLVTLDVSQEVSGVDQSVSVATTGISSPTFSERMVTSRVVIQDGQTVGLAGLITDSVTRNNSGIPFLKDIPLLGLLAGTQNNQRVRTELLVLITPHVLHNSQDANAFTQDLEDQLSNAAGVRQELQQLHASGSEDPNRPLREQLRLQR